MEITLIKAKTLPEAWFLCIKGVMENGYEYTIDKGSFAGQKRREFDFVVIQVEYPGNVPIIPIVPPNIPPPVTMDYVEKYMRYWITDQKEPGEEYTYGQDIAPQINRAIEMYRNHGYENNQVCISVGNAGSIILEHSQCLRLIDTRIRYGKLHFMVYFRSWDLWAGFPANLAAIQLIKEFMAKEIGVQDGELLACSKGLHLYDHCWPLANIVINR